METLTQIPGGTHHASPRVSRQPAAALICLAILTLPAFAQAAPSPDITERLAATARGLREELAGVSSRQSTFKPAPDRWSILECLEHIVLAEAAVTNVLRGFGTPAAAAAETTPPPAPTIADGELFGLATDRSRRFEAPGEIRPTGRFATTAEALAAFERGRKDLLETMAGAHGELRATGAVNPALGRYLDGVQWGLLAAGHVERHTLQIREVKASPQYPSS